ncbi:tigger transposable element-derived 1-like [Pelobates cultripes]|nr:tigger transposable element-derived 1-like [Pelobates cultripes]
MSTTPVSIPSKFQTVFIPESERKGFNSRALRFSYSLNQNENPGPGYYNVGHKSADVNSVSLSKKGTGCFPSKASRSSRFKSQHTPAPNTYQIQSALFSKKDFSTSNSSMFQPSIANKVEDTKNKTPAPNQYDASITFSHPSNNVAARAAFVSKTKREIANLNHLKGPSPCHYNVNDSLTKEAPKVLVSSFKSKTSRGILNVTHNPGPASYDPYRVPEVGKKLIFPRKHYLCISAPAIPALKSPPVPGPGQYEIVDYEGPSKQYISSSVFVSNTSRWTGDISGESFPGPEYGRSASTIATILKMKEKITGRDAAKGVTSVFKQQPPVLEEVEKLLLLRIEQKQHAWDTVTKAIICEKAKALHADLLNQQQETSANAEGFKASRGWFERFKTRSGIHSVVRHGEAAGSEFATEFLEVIVSEGYLPQQVFNCGETGIFWKRMPKRTFITQEETSLPGHKPMKDCFTLLFCANASGDLKMKPLLVYHSENPQAFKKHKWVSFVFDPAVKQYLVDNNLTLKAVLLMDNAPAHPPGLEEDLREDFNFIKAFRLTPPHYSSRWTSRSSPILKNSTQGSFSGNAFR